MRNLRIVLAVGLVSALAAIAISPALADSAPPIFPPGASIDSGDSPTHVQMVSERVDITIGSYQGSWVRNAESGAHVEAYFYMLNQGDKTETLDVRFPLKGIPPAEGQYYASKLENFKVWVDHKYVEPTEVEQPLADTGGEDRTLPWATWHTIFEPGRLVTIHVAYEKLSSIYGYDYVLETGAGWYGPIGDGMIVVHYPFEIDSLNATGRATEGTQYTVSGADMIWAFSNLEPTHKSNITFDVMSPADWGDILAARQRASREPGSLDAQLGLARALQQGLFIKYSVIPNFNSKALIDQVCAAYESALRVEPGNTDVYREYLDFVNSIEFFLDPPDPRLPPLLARALSIAPDNRDFQALQADIRKRYADATQQAIFALTPTRTRAPTRTPSPTAPTTPTPLPTDTLPPTTTAVSTPAPQPTITPVPPPPTSGRVQEWTPIVLLVLVAAIFGWVWLRRRSK